MEARPINITNIIAKTNNLYEAVIVAARRARQINDQNKLEYNQLAGSLLPAPDDEFDDRANPDLVKISLEFEKRAKPSQLALNELLTKGISYRTKE
ncbi:MAG: DNA-directed RNA polymerase subunit omega [Ignavibacteriales bacterium CG_4_9_14_3_um_filter_34_10]|nr:MAG: DNA-directed RNA polymerase subunit omega [Ignavibacteriales bacterium CG_4_9_14_3_um_filter_34_10]